MRRGTEHHGWLTRLRRGSFGLAALFAIALQVFVVQTHVHAFGAAHAALAFAQSPDDATAHARDGAGEAQRPCIVCQTLADTGRMLPPAAAQVQPAAARAVAAPAPAIRFVAAAPAHSWQSRAPPIVL